jgi:glutamyl/glutaminyl-tRNA synthetase
MSTIEPSTRFSPNATGPLHLGNAYVALLNREVASLLGLSYVLRVDDTIRGATREAVEAIHQDLDWLGVSFDFRTLSSQYYYKCPKIVNVDYRGRLVLRTGPSIHTAIDAFAGPLHVSESLFSLVDIHDRNPLVCADIADHVSLIVRDMSFLPYTSFYMALYMYYDKPFPILAHIPFLQDSTGSKMSKSVGGTVTIESLRTAGLSAEAAREHVIRSYEEGTNSSFDKQLAAIVETYNKHGRQTPIRRPRKNMRHT